MLVEALRPNTLFARQVDKVRAEKVCTCVSRNMNHENGSVYVVNRHHHTASGVQSGIMC